MSIRREKPSPNSATPGKNPYWCFISYRHADDSDQDRDWASWLQREIERYEIPAELIGTRNKRGDVIPERIYPVFRDEDSLSADADLESSIIEALEVSRYLVVLCSPRAVASRYVVEEILHFKRAGRQDRIIAAILDGEPGDGQRECFPIPLRHPVDDKGRIERNRRTEPIAADFRLPDGRQGFTSAEAYRFALAETGNLDSKLLREKSDAYALQLQLMKLKIIAGILGVPLEQLRNRDKAYQLELARRRSRILRRWLGAVTTLALLVIIAGIVANQQRIQADNQRDLAQQQELRAINQTMETSLELVARSWTDGEVPQAVAGLSRATALAAQARTNPKATDREGYRETRLRRQLGLIRQGWRVLTETEGARDYAWSADGSRLAVLSDKGRLRLWETATGRPIAQASTRLGDARMIRVAAAGNRVYAAGDRNVQKAVPLYIWQWNPETDEVKEVFMQGNTDDGGGATLRLFEMSPGGEFFALDFLGMRYLKLAASGQLETVYVGGDVMEEITFDPVNRAWIGRQQHSFLKIDPENGKTLKLPYGIDRGSESKQSRLFSIKGKHYAFQLLDEGDGRVRWKELAEGGTAGEFALERPQEAAETRKRSVGFDMALLTSEGTRLALPVREGTDARMDFYDTISGSFTGVFRLPSERTYEGLRFSPARELLAAPAKYGVELWKPILYEPTEPSANAAATMPKINEFGSAITLNIAEKPETLELRRLRDPEAVQHVLGISSAINWPDQNHLLVGFSDLKIGHYRIEPFERLDLWAHHVEPESLTESQNFILRVQGSFLNLTASPRGKAFISWSEYGGAQLWNLQRESQTRALQSLNDISQVLYRPDGGAIWVLHDKMPNKLSIFSAAESPHLLRSIPMGLEGRIGKTAPPVGIAVMAGNWPELIIDPDTGMSLAAYFRKIPATEDSVAFRVRSGDESLQIEDARNEGQYGNEEKLTGYRWKPDRSAPSPLSWEEVQKAWREDLPGTP